MIKNSLSFIINSVAKLPKAEQVEALRQNGTPPIQALLKFACDPKIKFLLPEGKTPYQPSPHAEEAHGVLPGEIRRLYLFVEGGNPNLNPLRRETLWVELLQHVNPSDAVLLDLMKDKKLPDGLTVATVKKAFPDLF